VIGVPVREQHGIHPSDALRKGLLPKIRRGIDQDARTVRDVEIN